MRIGVRRCRVQPVGAVQVPSTPPTACAQEIFVVDFMVILEHQKPALRHLLFQRLQHLVRRGRLCAQVNAADLRANRLKRGDLPAKGLNNGHMVGVQCGNCPMVFRQCAPP